MSRTMLACQDLSSKEKKAVELILVAVSRGQDEKEDTRSNAWVRIFPTFFFQITRCHYKPTEKLISPMSPLRLLLPASTGY